MTTSMLAFGKASASGNLKPASITFRKYTSTATAPATVPSAYGKSVPNRNDPVMQRELFLDILSANATKRDAKQYLARFKKPKSVEHLAKNTLEFPNRHVTRLAKLGVNLGELYTPSQAIANSPQFEQQENELEKTLASEQKLHVSLICLRAPQALDDDTLEAMAVTLTQLVKLDMRLVLVVELDEFASTFNHENVRLRRAAFAEQAERLSQAIRRHSPDGSRFVTGAFETQTVTRDFEPSNVSIAMPQLILEPLQRGVVPILPCLAYTTTGQLVEVRVTDVMAALTEELGAKAEQANAPSPISLERIIVLDPAGGIPSRDRGDQAHVFVNLEQEFDDILDELSGYAKSCGGNARVYEQHQENLRMLKRCLGMLPSASSALIVAPREAARSSQLVYTDEPAGGAGTRRQKNTLIHNLLTNKPLISSSLPSARMPTTSGGSVAKAGPKTATLVKYGMPLTIIPAADRKLGWKVPDNGHTSLALETDSRVNFRRLVHLIENSFRRELNVQHYLNRIRGRTAGLIVAGEYEGCAILTWEQPPGTSDPNRLVPYLDKFAVLQSSQGSAGVADILFQAMVRSCFPDGVCWRSRKDNPVNKWYFERAVGSWQIPGSNWTMFWTGDGVVEGKARFDDYVEVCRLVVPSWMDGKKPD